MGTNLTDEELHAEMMADTFVGGSETSTNAIPGVMLLIQQPDQWDILKSDPDSYLPVLLKKYQGLKVQFKDYFVKQLKILNCMV